MVIRKALLTCLFGVSLCMANISGIVTDTGTTSIVGAVVQLENGGQKVITGSDGRFVIDFGTVVLPGKSKSLSNSLSAMLFGSMLNLTIKENSSVELAIFDLTGKALFAKRKTLNAGSHSIPLPFHSAGIYLCKVKSGNSELVLKGNSVGAVSTGSAAFSQGSSSKPLSKQAMRTALINDVITVTKKEYLNYRCVQYNSDTAGIQIKMIASAGTVTDTDGNVYQTVKIGNQEWMAENLRVTKYNDGTAIPLDTSTADWDATTPKYCFYKDTKDKKYGALYNGYIVSPSNHKKIAPAGWHVPTYAEWDTLQNYMIAKGYNWDETITGNKIAKSLAAKTDWGTNSTTGTIGCDMTKNNSSGFSALPGGGNRSFQCRYSHWWSATEISASYAYGRILSHDRDVLFSNGFIKSCGFAVRLVKD